MNGAITGQTTIGELLGQKASNDALASTDIEQIIEELAMKRREIEQTEQKRPDHQAATEEEQLQHAGQKESEERIARATSLELPPTWENPFAGDARAAEYHAESISDGLLLSLANLGHVDIEYIAAVSDSDLKTVVTSLRGSIYQNPATWNECFYKGWETAGEYLSGRLVPKLREAKKANCTYNGWFSDNVRALECAMPSPLAAEGIYITLGSPWVPADVIDGFIEHLFGPPKSRITLFNGIENVSAEADSQAFSEVYGVRHDLLTGTWEIPEKNRFMHSVAVRNTYGTSRMEALAILERTLNLKVIAVYDETSCPQSVSGTKRVVNQPETELAREKQHVLTAEFKSWVWQDEQRAERLRGLFEEHYGCMAPRRFKGEFLTLPTMSPSAHLYPYQKDAVARILLSPNTLLAHEVGCGKTYVMVAAGMELVRTGRAQKNLYVVPNSIVGQWRSVFAELYPQANVLCVEPSSFGPARRRAVLEDVRDTNYDAVIMAYTCFERIPLSKRFYDRKLEEGLQQIKKALSQPRASASKLNRMERALRSKLNRACVARPEGYNGICFDELGIDRLFVDEAHNFKNVPLQTDVQVLGLSTKGSKHCQAMLDKVRAVQRANGAGGVVMATGTPVSNSIADIYAMQIYLQNDSLENIGLLSFTSWLAMFGEIRADFEIDVDTTRFRTVSRLSHFHNLQQLTALLSEIADFHKTEFAAGLPQLKGRTDERIEPTPEFTQYLSYISKRTSNVRAGRVNRKVDNMLKITCDGRAAALDMRLIDPGAPSDPQGKIARCADNVWRIYRETSAEKGCQLVMCDLSIPKRGWNVYDELKNELIGKGLPAHEIAFVHDAKNGRERSRLFARVRAGDVRVLIGSTMKLGTGVNVQDRLVALHHLDVPWRPADITQREGRILRQGNRNARVRIIRYVTEGSFDAYSWQLLEAKQRFISELLAGSLSMQDAPDIGDATLDYAEVKAIAIGNPLIKARVRTATELSRLSMLQSKNVEVHNRQANELAALPARIEHQRALVNACAADAAFAITPAANRANPESSEARKQRSSLRQRVAAALFDNVLAREEHSLASYRGFDIVLPSNMLAEKPFVWIVRNGRWRVNMGTSERGMLTRIDNAIDGLPTRCEDLAARLRNLEEQKAKLADEVMRTPDYQEQIEALRTRLGEIDHELGV